MLPTRPSSSRYLQTARRAYVSRAGAARIVAAGALVVLPACGGGGDAEVFGAATTSVAVDTDSGSTEPAVTPVEPTTEVVVDTATDRAGAGFPAGAEMVVDFTYSPSSGGQVHNPYVAVWVEDVDGDLVQTISLWYEQSGKGTRWLKELRAWYSAANGSDAAVTTSGATRSAGSYSVVWDGTDLDGNLVAAGDYVLYVEAAREHGPYEITSAAFTVDGSPFSVALDDNGELGALSATLSV